MGSVTAQLALLLWIPVGLWLISSAKTPQKGFLLVFLGGILFLPERMALEIPLIPPMHKLFLTSVVAWIGLSMFQRKAMRKGPATGSATTVTVLLILSGIATWLTNGDNLAYGTARLTGVTYKDMILGVEKGLLAVALPYYLGLCVFRTADDLRVLFRGIVWAALIYAPLVLLEVRLAPFLHTMVYGYFQHSFTQSRRSDGFRAFVFMAHGLSVAFFMAQAVLATVTLHRIKDAALPLSTGKAGWLLTATLATSRSAASLVYTGLLAPSILFLKGARQVGLARLLSIAVLGYPLARLNAFISTEWIFEKVVTINEERAHSLRFRFMNEDILLDKAIERPWFGWGWSGRNMVYDEGGMNISVTDGEWVIHMGQGGLVKFFIVFGVLLLPIWRISKVWPRIKDDATGQLLASCALLLVLQSIDMLPNATSNSLAYVIAGAATSVAAAIRSPSPAT